MARRAARAAAGGATGQAARRSWRSGRGGSPERAMHEAGAESRGRRTRRLGSGQWRLKAGRLGAGDGRRRLVAAAGATRDGSVEAGRVEAGSRRSLGGSEVGGGGLSRGLTAEAARDQGGSAVRHQRGWRPDTGPACQRGPRDGSGQRPKVPRLMTREPAGAPKTANARRREHPQDSKQRESQARRLCGCCGGSRHEAVVAHCKAAEARRIAVKQLRPRLGSDAVVGAGPRGGSGRGRWWRKATDGGRADWCGSRGGAQ